MVVRNFMSKNNLVTAFFFFFLFNFCIFVFFFYQFIFLFLRMVYSAVLCFSSFFFYSVVILSHFFSPSRSSVKAWSWQGVGLLRNGVQRSV